jgi:hypothetical protein
MINYGAAKDGYWNANHMLLQVTDCLDVWNNLDRTSYLFPLWEFDHSSGHDSERKDGLTTSATNLKMSWGKGRQMRESVLTDACVGTIDHEDCAHTGSTYSHQFLPGDKPPIFFDGKEPPPEYEIILERGAETKDKTKDNLVRDLEVAERNAKGNVPVLKE